MKLLLLLLLSINVVFGCFRIHGFCECGNLYDLFEGNYPLSDDGDAVYTEKPGCLRSVVCLLNYFTFLSAHWSESEIPKSVEADEANDNFYIVSNKTVAGPVDIFDYYGMQCDNGNWVVTKYPAGIEFTTTNGVKVVGPNDELYNGKKTRFHAMRCTLNPRPLPTNIIPIAPRTIRRP